MKNTQDSLAVIDANAAIYSSYELIHDAIAAKKTQTSEDALDLLKIFSFLHLQRIRVDFFLCAGSNPGLEMQERQRREQPEGDVNHTATPRMT